MTKDVLAPEIPVEGQCPYPLNSSTIVCIKGCSICSGEVKEYCSDILLVINVIGVKANVLNVIFPFVPMISIESCSEFSLATKHHSPVPTQIGVLHI